MLKQFLKIIRQHNKTNTKYTEMYITLIPISSPISTKIKPYLDLNNSILIYFYIKYYKSFLSFHSGMK